MRNLNQATQRRLNLGYARFEHRCGRERNVLRFISSFDESIVDFEIEEVKKTDEKLLGKTYVLHTIHKLADGGGLQSILLGNESSGTKKCWLCMNP